MSSYIALFCHITVLLNTKNVFATDLKLIMPKQLYRKKAILFSYDPFCDFMLMIFSLYRMQ